MRNALLVIALLTFTFVGQAFAGFDEGLAAYQKKDWAGAIVNLRPLAESGDAKAMVILGNMYLDGLGVGMDKAEAFGLYRRAALRHNPDAMVVVAAMYQQGLGVAKNQRYAAGWFGRAARLGHASGAFFYGVHLFRGNRGAAENDYISAFQPDHDAAYKWLRIAASRTVNEKLAAKAAKIADGLAQKLGTEKTRTLDQEAKDWIPEVPATLGPLPEDLPAQKGGGGE